MSGRMSGLISRGQMSELKHHSGFTLIELLIAMALFVLLAAAMYGGTSWIMEEREIVGQRTAELQSLQRTVRILQADLGQAWPRSIRDELGRGKVAAILTERSGGIRLQLTRSGWRNPAGNNRSNLQRVQYRYDPETQSLYRDTWPVLERVLGSEAREQLLLEKLTEFEIEFLNSDGNWTPDWPPESATGFTVMPRALRYRLDTESFGLIQRIVELPG